MTANRLYGLIIELAFGDKNVVYVIADSFKSRKAMGPVLVSLLEEYNINIDNCNSYEWTIRYDDQEKYLRFTPGISLTPAEEKYSTRIYI